MGLPCSLFSASEFCVILSGPGRLEKAVKSSQFLEACWLKGPLEGLTHGSVGDRGDDNALPLKEAEVGAVRQQQPTFKARKAGTPPFPSGSPCQPPLEGSSA